MATISPTHPTASTTISYAISTSLTLTLLPFSSRNLTPSPFPPLLPPLLLSQHPLISLIHYRWKKRKKEKCAKSAMSNTSNSTHGTKWEKNSFYGNKNMLHERKNEQMRYGKKWKNHANHLQRRSQAPEDMITCQIYLLVLSDRDVATLQLIYTTSSLFDITSHDIHDIQFYLFLIPDQRIFV